MNTAAELLSIPHSKLTRKQRKERAQLKRLIAQEAHLPAGYALGKTRVVADEPFAVKIRPEDWAGSVTLRFSDQS